MDPTEKSFVLAEGEATDNVTRVLVRVKAVPFVPKERVRAIAVRPVLTVAQVGALADAMPEQYRALSLVTAFGCLRWGEVIALQRKDIDSERGTVRVRQAVTEQRGVSLIIGPPKSRAGRRVVSLPPLVVSAIREHLARYVHDDPEAFVFTGPTGRLLWRGNFNKLVNWQQAMDTIGRPGLHFHDLRHREQHSRRRRARACGI